MLERPAARTLLIAAAAALAGCGGGTSESDVITAEPAARDTVVVLVDENAPAARPFTLPLQPLNNSDVGGQVTLTQVGTREVEIAIALTGGAAAGQHYAGVYRGTCEEPGTLVEALRHVGSDGATGSTTTLQLPLAQMLAGSEVVIVRADASGQAEPVACATLVPAEGAAGGAMDRGAR